MSGQPRRMMPRNAILGLPTCLAGLPFSRRCKKSDMMMMATVAILSMLTVVALSIALSQMADVGKGSAVFLWVVLGMQIIVLSVLACSFKTGTNIDQLCKLRVAK